MPLFLSVLDFAADGDDPAGLIACPPEWRPDPGDPGPANAAESYYCVVVARKP